MWQCRKCSKPVFFAERKQSLGFDWHPNCLRCEECGKCLNPGQHAEHKGVPYCHHPCYGALFGPQLFGHGTRNECHTSFGKVKNEVGNVKRSHLEAHLKLFNNFYEGKPGELKVREVNGKLILEGILRIYWGVRTTIHLKEDDDNRISSRKLSNVQQIKQDCLQNRNNNDHISIKNEQISDQETFELYLTKTLPVCNAQDDDALNSFTADVEDFQPNILLSPLLNETPAKVPGSTALRRVSGRKMDKTKLKRRCSINGHFYLKETSSFTPPYGSPCSIWVTSKTTAEEVLNILLEKYKVEMSANNFALFVIKDSGELRRVKNDEYPLITRVMLGPHEEISKVFIMDAHKTKEIPFEVAQFLNLSLTECRAIFSKYEEEERKQVVAIQKKFSDLRFAMQRRLQELHSMNMT